MNLVLSRRQYRADGIFGDLSNESGAHIAVTLEHAYPIDADATGYAPKVPLGTYLCRRGMHQLSGTPGPFETFEITEVPGHTKILFHVGNFNNDSEGCVLLGDLVGSKADGSCQMILNSRITFSEFMRIQADSEEFHLIVS